VIRRLLTEPDDRSLAGSWISLTEGVFEHVIQHGGAHGEEELHGELRRVCRRFQLLRRWSHDDEGNNEQFVARGARARGTDGAGPCGRVPDALGGRSVDCGQDRVRGTDAGEGAEKLKALERENRELRQANEILRKASAYFAQVALDRPFKQ